MRYGERGGLGEKKRWRICKVSICKYNSKKSQMCNQRSEEQAGVGAMQNHYLLLNLFVYKCTRTLIQGQLRAAIWHSGQL